jgi:hypothetical protein
MSRRTLRKPIFVPNRSRREGSGRALSRRSLRNMIAVTLAGVLMLWWLRCFTESFEVVVTFLGLGGILVWASFVWNFIGPARQTQIKDWAAEQFEKTWPERVALLGFVLFFLTSLCWGTIRVENLQGGDAIVQVYRGQGPARGRAERVPTGGGHNFPQALWPCDTTTVRVKVAGLPDREVTLRPWWRSGGPERLQVPGAFLRPVVLIGAEAKVVLNADKSRHRLTVTINDQNYEMAYDGRAVLVGTSDTDLPLPSELHSIREWKTVLDQFKTAARLMPPNVLGGAPSLKSGDRLTARITEQDKNVVLAESVPVIVTQPYNRTDLVLPVLLIESKKN